MAAHGVKTLIYSSTCATYGEPDTMPITEETPQVPINPYGKAKKMAEDIILDFSKNSNMAVMILRFVLSDLLFPPNFYLVALCMFFVKLTSFFLTCLFFFFFPDISM